MKTKLTLLFLALFVSIGALAETVTVANNNNTTGPDTYGGLSNNIWTSKAASGIAGLKITTPGTIGWGNQNEIRGLWIRPTAENAATTVTITAPDGYYIIGYKLIAESSGGTRYFDVAANEGSGTTSFTGLVGTTNQKTISVGGIRSTTATFDITCTSGGNYYIIFRGFFVSLMPTSESEKTYCISLGNGTIKQSGSTEKNDPVNETWCNNYESSQTTPLIKMSTGTEQGNIFRPVINAKYDLDTRNGTYTISTTSNAHLITGVKIVGTAQSNANSITYNGNKTNFAVGTENTLTINDVCTSSLSFSIGTNSYFYTKIYVTLADACDVTYIIKDGSVTVSGGTAKHVKGSVPNIAKTVGNNSGSSYNNPYCTYSYYSDETCNNPMSTITSTCAVYAKVTSTSNVPVEFASAVNDENAQWYTLKLRNYSFYVSGGTVTLNSGDITSASAQWVFTGSVYNAHVYNKEAEKYLIMSNGALALSDTPQSWILAPHQSGSGFYLYYASDYKFPFRNSSGNLAYSTGPFYETANAASFVATEVADDYSSEIIANVQPYFTTGVGSYFGLKSDVKTYYEERVTAAATSCSADEYSALYAVVSDASNFVYPISGYYRFRNYSGGYFGKTASDGVVGGLTSTAAASVLYLTRSGEEGSYIYTIQVQGSSYIEQTGNFTLSVAAPGYFYFNDRTSNTLFGFIQANGSTISVDSKNNAAKWIIEEATDITLSLNSVDGNTYGTTYLPFGVTLPAGDVCAYTLTDNKNGWLTLNLLGTDGKSIPAGTPVLLKGTSTESVTATIADVAAIDAENALSGTYVNIDHGDNLVLGKKDDVVGFYKYNFEIKANKAYIANASNVRGFILMDDDDATGIGSLTPTLSEGEGAVTYNLAGQRVSRAQKGIYIVNGKKILK